MTITVPTVRDVPANALRAVLQGPTGPVLVYMPGDTLPPAPVPSLADAKASRIAAINAECTARITAVWPIPRQISALAGIYGPAELAAMTDLIDAHIAASNTASDAVDAATTIAAVEAVTVAWPA